MFFTCLKLPNALIAELRMGLKRSWISHKTAMVLLFPLSLFFFFSLLILFTSFLFLNFFVVHVVLSLLLCGVIVKIRSFPMQYFLPLQMLFLFPYAYTICLCVLWEMCRCWSGLGGRTQVKCDKFFLPAPFCIFFYFIMKLLCQVKKEGKNQRNNSGI